MTEYIIKKQSSLTSSFLWMFIISVLLFWLPIVGTFIGGLVGGKKAGGVGRAFTASILPAIVIALLLITFSGSFVLPPIAALLGGAVVIIYIANLTSLVIGAVVGGALA
ncbi:MAG: hypothetical protein GY855_07740 [candidate division Zixibacteria bacterium]|nr:hypothetical protein [candidate division Zixibacteria bacterium]